MKCKFCGQEMEDTKIGEHYNYRDCAYALRARVEELERSLHDQIVEDNKRIVSRNERILALEAQNAALRERVDNLKMTKDNKARVQAVKHMLEQTSFIRKCFALDVFRSYPRLRDEGLKIIDGELNNEEVK